MSKMFHDCVDLNGVQMSTNAHPESQYEGHRLKPSYGPFVLGPDGAYVESPLSMSQRVRSQVLKQSGSRLGSMTFHSEIER